MKTPPTAAIIQIRHLKKAFDQQPVLTDINLDLNTGKNLVVLGKSGSGKSVLIKCIIGLLQFDGGSIQVNERDVGSLTHKQWSELRHETGFLFQSGALYDSMTVEENLEFPLRRMEQHLNSQQIKKKIRDVLDEVGLAEALTKMPSQLSGGMRKRISLARTIIVEPKIMLYDEPTTGLDPVTSNEISELILRFQKKFNTSSIIITHDINCARKTADRMVMLHQGAVYLEGSIKDFDKSTDPFIKSFLS